MLVNLHHTQCINDRTKLKVDLSQWQVFSSIFSIATDIMLILNVINVNQKCSISFQVIWFVIELRYIILCVCVFTVRVCVRAKTKQN